MNGWGNEDNGDVSEAAGVKKGEIGDRVGIGQDEKQLGLEIKRVGRYAICEQLMQGLTQMGAEGASPLGFSGPCGQKAREDQNSCEGIRNSHRSREIPAETYQKSTYVRTVEGFLTIWVYLENGPTRQTGSL